MEINTDVMPVAAGNGVLGEPKAAVRHTPHCWHHKEGSVNIPINHRSRALKIYRKNSL